MTDAKRDVAGVRVLHKTLDILEAIKRAPAGFRLAELARSVEMPKATAHRILATLEGRGYVDRAEDGGYRVAKKLLDMQQPASVDQILSAVAPPLIAQLAAACRETVNLGVLDAGEVVVIQTVESPQAVRMSSKVGNRRHLHATALGKVMLAGMSDKEVLRLIRLKGQARLTPHTITTRPGLLEELSKIRKQGYSIDNQENEIEGRCLGAAIYTPDGRVAAALSISGPVYRMDVARARSLAPKLKETCAAISAALAKESL
jgi:IclR family KDG regulon transcriptional repressor